MAHHITDDNGVVSESVIRENENWLFKTHNECLIATEEEIVRFESSEGFTSIFLHDGSWSVIRKTLKEVEASFTASYFMRVHHSHFINLHYIRMLRKKEKELVMKDGKVIPISIRKKEEIMTLLDKMDSI